MKQEIDRRYIHVDIERLEAEAEAQRARLTATGRQPIGFSIDSRSSGLRIPKPSINIEGGGYITATPTQLAAVPSEQEAIAKEVRIEMTKGGQTSARTLHPADPVRVTPSGIYLKSSEVVKGARRRDGDDWGAKPLDLRSCFSGSIKERKYLKLLGIS